MRDAVVGAGGLVGLHDARHFAQVVILAYWYVLMKSSVPPLKPVKSAGRRVKARRPAADIGRQRGPIVIIVVIRGEHDSLLFIVNHKQKRIVADFFQSGIFPAVGVFADVPKAD